MSPALFQDTCPRSLHHVPDRRARKHIPHALRPSDFVKKRNQRERNRANTVNQAFVHLRNILPLRDDKISKMTILKHASLYIQYLAHTLTSQTQEQLQTLNTNSRRQHFRSCQSGTRLNNVNCETDIFQPLDTHAETHPYTTSPIASPCHEQIQDRTGRESKASQRQHHCANTGIHLGQWFSPSTFQALPQHDQARQQSAVRHPGDEGPSSVGGAVRHPCVEGQSSVGGAVRHPGDEGPSSVGGAVRHPCVEGQSSVGGAVRHPGVEGQSSEGGAVRHPGVEGQSSVGGAVRQPGVEGQSSVGWYSLQLPPSTVTTRDEISNTTPLTRERNCMNGSPVTTVSPYTHVA